MIRFGMHYSFIRGMDSENNVEKALQELQKENRIAGYKRAARNSKLDHQGIDFVVTKPNGKDEFIQVKSSDNAVAKWNRKHGRPKAVNGQDENVLQKVAKLLFGQIREGFHGMRNVLELRWQA